MTYTVVFCAVLAVGVAALLVVIAMIDRRWRSQDLPKARVVVPPGQPGVVAAKLRPVVCAVIATGVLVGAAASLWWLHCNHVEMIVVTESGSALHADRFVQLGAPPAALPIDRTSTRESFFDGDVWIFNKSQHTLRLENTDYGTLGIPSFHLPHEISPGTMGHTSRVDYIGPEDVPPSTITVSQTEVTATRTWLTWDR